MPYARRDAAGQIESLHRQPGEGTEFVADGASEVLAFVNAAPATDFNQLDADFVRVLEDVIDTLIGKNLINITDLPEQAQAKLFARKSFRDRVSTHSLQLFERAGADDVI